MVLGESIESREAACLKTLVMAHSRLSVLWPDGKLYARVSNATFFYSCVKGSFERLRVDGKLFYWVLFTFFHWTRVLVSLDVCFSLFFKRFLNRSQNSTTINNFSSIFNLSKESNLTHEWKKYNSSFFFSFF